MNPPIEKNTTSGMGLIDMNMSSNMFKITNITKNKPMKRLTSFIVDISLTLILASFNDSDLSAKYLILSNISITLNFISQTILSLDFSYFLSYIIIFLFILNALVFTAREIKIFEL